MKENKVIMIGGKPYDKTTGLPIKNASASHAATNAPTQTQASRPSTIKTFRNTARNHARRSMDIARNKSVSRFSKPVEGNVKPQSKTVTSSSPDIQPMRHPIARRVDSLRKNQTAKASVPAQKTSKQIKEEAIAAAMKKADENKQQATPPKKVHKKWRKPLIVVAFIIAVIAAASLVTYFFLPSISVYVASAQARVNAKFPTYIPDGYQVNGPVSYSNGKVTINFAATAGDANFKLTQTKSSWDSSALKNKVNDDSNSEFITTTFDGLTIFTYDDSASWVNNGVLYEISGNSPLSSDQVRQIAISLCS